MDNKSIIVKKYILQALGVFLLGAGIAINSASLFGTDPMSVFLNGGAVKFNTTMGIVNLFVCVFMIAVGYIADKKMVSLATFISMIVSTVAIDLVAKFLPTNPTMPIRIIMMTIGILLYTFGTALSQFPHCGYMTYDCLIFGLAKLFKIDSYHMIRWITDISFMVCGWLLGGRVGICTVILMLTAGKLVEFFLAQLNKHFSL